MGVTAAPGDVPEERLPARESELDEVALGAGPGRLVSHHVGEDGAVEGCRTEVVVVCEA